MWTSTRLELQVVSFFCVESKTLRQHEVIDRNENTVTVNLIHYYIGNTKKKKRGGEGGGLRDAGMAGAGRDQNLIIFFIQFPL